MTRRLVMDDRPSSRGAPPTPPSSMAIVAAPSSASPPAAPSPGKDTPGPAPTPPLMLATMTPVNVDGYLYEHHPEHIPHSHHSHHPHQPPVIYSTASLTASLADHVPVGVPVGVPEDALMDGTVSVVYQQQVPSNTVVIMSELVDDMSPVLQLRTRRKDVADGSPGDPDVDAPPPPSEADGHQWRSSLEHPLTAATSAMLNINAGPDDPGQPASGNPVTYSVYEYKTDKLGELWSSAAGGAAGAGGGVLQLKAANGAAGAGLAGAALDGDLHGLFLQPQQQQQQQQQLLVKREPEDLSHRKQQPSPGLAGGRSSSNGSSGSTKLVLANGVTDVVDVIKDEYKTMAYSTQMFGGQPTPQGHHGSGTPSPGPYNDLQYAAAPPGPGHGGPNQPVYMSPVHVPNLRTAPPPPPPTSTGFTTVSERYYTDYFPPVPEQGYAPLRQQIPTYMDSAGAEAANGPTAVSAADLVQRYVRQTTTYHQNKSVISAATGLTVDLPSPDSGIGAEAITPRDQTAIQQSFDYTDLCSGQGVLDPLTVRPPSQVQSPGPQSGPGQPAPPRSRPWHDFGRQNDADKIQIPKLYSSYGFKYTLETPISTSQRREDDRVTYINKGQFYGITMEYIPDPDAPMLKNHTVKSVVMLMFREEKSPEDEIKAWQFWHGRQHSVKQRILDADTKNSMGLVGCIEEVAHNAIAVYWNPLESPAKINVAVQCLSTDFSSQKGVKGLPLHIQIDTYEDPRDGPVYHRGYCQIKVFCDKGAERKTRDEERRAAKRKMTATGRKKLDELYHPAAERTEFYCMADLHKPPVLFTPSEEMTSMELQGFYGHDTDNSSVSNGEGGIGLKSTGPPGAGASPFLLHSAKPLAHQTLKFHNHFPPDAPCVKKEHSSLEPEPLSTDGGLFNSQAIKRPRLIGPPGPTVGVGPPTPQLSHHGLGPAPGHTPSHTPLMGHPGHPGTPPLTERVMLYVRQESEDVYTPLHVVPPSTQGLLNAIENKYKISPSSISNLYRKNKKGIMVKIDDEMVKHYCNEDLFILEVKRDTHTDEEELYEITLIELPSP